MGHLSLALFGPFRLVRDGQLLTSLYSDKVRALLAFLAIEPDSPHRRERLAGLLWPEYPESRARHSLSQALLRLRRTLDQQGASTGEDLHLITTQHTVLLSGAAGHVDAADFVALLAACEAHPHDRLVGCPACCERLSQAAELYTGELLTGFSLPDSPGFEEWLIVQRERFHRLAVEALRTLAELFLAMGDRSSDEHVAHARRWAELEPLDDRAQRALMLALARDGRRGAALAQYERFGETLRDEMGIEPEAATTTLHQRIYDGTLGAVVEPPASPPGFLAGPERYLPPLFVAREHELGLLQEHLARTLAGEPRVAFVAGDPGSGKTSLVREFCLRALSADSQLVTAMGHCNAHTGLGDPYLAFRELLAQLCGDVETRWAAGAISGEQARRLWGLVPETGQALAELGPDLVGTLVHGEQFFPHVIATTPPGAAWQGTLRGLIRDRGTQTVDPLQRAALFGQVTAVLQRLARRHPLLLVIEDLQWADSGTVALLFHLGCRLLRDHILILGTYRPTEVLAAPGSAPAEEAGDGRHPLVPVIHEFVRRYGDIEVDLSRADGRGFVDALLDSEPNGLGSDFRARMLRQCNGNALFATELLHSLKERGSLIRNEAGRWVEARPWDWSSLPARVEGVLAERIGRLPAPLHEALKVASVEGETFHVDSLAQVLRRGPDELLRWLSGELDRRHRLVGALEGPQAGTGFSGRYRFRHILVQSYLYDSLDPVERGYLHRSVAEALEALYGGDEDEVAVQLARHYEQAGATERAVAWLRRAGDRAARLAAFAESRAHYTRGLGLLAGMKEGAERDASELALLLGVGGSMYVTVGAAAGLEPLAERALALAERSHDVMGCIYALSMLADHYTYRCEYQAAEMAAAKLVEWAQRTEDDAVLAWTHSRWAVLHVYQGHFRRAVQELEPMRAFWNAADLAALRQRLDRGGLPLQNGLFVAVLAQIPLGHCAAALALVRDALSLARETGHEVELCHAHLVAVLTYVGLRDYQQALPWAQEFSRRAARSGFDSWHMASVVNEGCARAHLGEAREGIAQVRAGLAQAEAAGDRTLLPSILSLLAECYLADEQAQQALDTAERGLAFCAEFGCGLSLSPLHLRRGQALLLLAPPDVARGEEALLEAISVAQRQEARLYELRASVALGHMWQSQGRVAEARELVQPVYDWFTEGFDARDLVEARALLTGLAA